MLPAIIELCQNYPNPFNQSTTITINMTKAEKVSLIIYDLLGQKVKTIYQDQYLEPGYKTTSWNGIDDLGCIVSSGIYFYRLVFGNKTISKKMLLIR